MLRSFEEGRVPLADHFVARTWIRRPASGVNAGRRTRVRAKQAEAEVARSDGPGRQKKYIEPTKLTLGAVPQVGMVAEGESEVLRTHVRGGPQHRREVTSRLSAIADAVAADYAPSDIEHYHSTKVDDVVEHDATVAPHGVVVGAEARETG